MTKNSLVIQRIEDGDEKLSEKPKKMMDNVWASMIFMMLGSLSLFFVCYVFYLLIFDPVDPPGNAKLFWLLGIFPIVAMTINSLLGQKINGIKENLPVQPSLLFSRYDIFAYSVGLIQDRVNTMISRWNRYCELRDVEYMEPLLNEAQMHESLLNLREETARHVQAAVILLQMEREGDFKPQLTAPDDSLMTSFEHVRELEDQIRRSLNGIEHRLHDPLAVAANVAALEEEIGQDFGVVSPKLKAARAMGHKLANGS